MGLGRSAISWDYRFKGSADIPAKDAQSEASDSSLVIHSRELCYSEHHF
jgi:hypothetical protein